MFACLRTGTAHCSNQRVSFLLQTDKASMLDEAIEYLKMLQLQLQVRHQLDILDSCHLLAV